MSKFTELSRQLRFVSVGLFAILSEMFFFFVKSLLVNLRNFSISSYIAFGNFTASSKKFAQKKSLEIYTFLAWIIGAFGLTFMISFFSFVVSGTSLGYNNFLWLFLAFFTSIAIWWLLFWKRPT